jgi:hypothetical protein
MHTQPMSDDYLTNTAWDSSLITALPAIQVTLMTTVALVYRTSHRQLLSLNRPLATGILGIVVRSHAPVEEWIAQRRHALPQLAALPQLYTHSVAKLVIATSCLWHCTGS